MRFLHTSDLHFGKRLFGISLIEDQQFVVDQIIDIAVKEAVDGVLLAGDIYDKTIPNPDAILLFERLLNGLVKNNIDVYAIYGNHDNPIRVSYLKELAKKNRIFLCKKFDGEIEIIKKVDEYGEINIYLMPFIKPQETRLYYNDEKISSYEDSIKAVLNRNKVSKSSRNVCLSHQFVDGASICDSEELSIGGLENISASLYDGFDYVALGHIHSPQKVKRDTLRYSGSILKYSFSEINNKTSVVIVDIKEKGNVTYKLVPLVAKHNLREIKGDFYSIMNMDYSEDFISVTLTDEDVLPDARVSISTVFPNLLHFKVENSKTIASFEAIEFEDINNMSEIQLFQSFYKQQSGVDLDDDRLKYVTKIFEEVKEQKE